MLLDPSSTAAAGPGGPSAAPASRGQRRARQPPLTPAQAARADARTGAILNKYGVDFRPAQETVLVALATGAVYPLNETKERPIFAAQARRRAAAMAITFDAFRQGCDLGNLRLIGIRPDQGKAAPGTLAKALAAFARDYDRRVGRLVTAGTIRPVLSVIHVRYDVALNLWDIHAHALWDVPDNNMEAMWIGLDVAFADKWMDENKVESPGAAANYCLSRVIDHREIMKWPEAAVLELWNLPRVRLMRPAGAFRAFRGTLKGKVLRRRGERVVVEERPDPGPCQKARERPGPAVEGGRVVAITKARIEGEEILCAVVETPRAASAAEGIGGGPGAPSHARDYLAYGEYRHNSPPADTTIPRASPIRGSLGLNGRPACTPRKAARAALHALPPRKSWMLKAWPLRAPGRLPRAITRRLPPSASRAPRGRGRHGCPAVLGRPSYPQSA